MEKDCFEDNEVAEILNKSFISIKVDREERPDIDQVYMTACQAMTGHGGWPLTVILTPGKEPFFAGTYFPKNKKWGRPGLMEILETIAQKWRDDPTDLTKMGTNMQANLTRIAERTNKGHLSEQTLNQCLSNLANSFDPKYGGFQSAPKFPTPHNLIFLLRQFKLSGKQEALEMAEKTLQSMFLGGMYDHIGFGFSRYSTDNKWLVPHFEKMLYDNALLAYTYLEAFQATKKPEYSRVAAEIFQYIIRDMTSPSGSFYSADDADSDGVEGKFYVWTKREILDFLGNDDGVRFCEAYNITDGGNFEGFSIPNLMGTPWDSVLALKDELDPLRESLFLKRESRVHPFRDDKVLTGWNCLMIAAFAKGYQVMGSTEYLDRANSALKFILGNLLDNQGNLLARYRDGEAQILAYLDDYAFLIWALLELYDSTLDEQFLSLAKQFSAKADRLFYDSDQGGYFFYSHTGEQLIVRPKEVYDGALPSGNSVMALNFARLAHITEDARYLKTAQHQFETFGGDVERNPEAHCYMLLALQMTLVPIDSVEIIGQRQDELFTKMILEINSHYNPFRATRFQETHDSELKAKVCKDMTCFPEVNSTTELRSILEKNNAGQPVLTT